MELISLQLLICELLQGRVQVGSAEVRRHVHSGEARSGKRPHIGAEMLSCHVLGHPGQLVFYFGAVDGFRKNDHDRTPRLSLRSQTTPNLPDLCLNLLAHPGNLGWIGRRTRYCQHQCRRIPEVLDVQDRTRALRKVVNRSPA